MISLLSFSIASLASIAINIFHIASGFIISVVLARALEPEGYGVYTFALTVAALLAIPAQAGLPTLLIREVSKFQQSENWSLLKGILQRANQITFIFSAIILVIAIVIVMLLDDDTCSENTRITFLLAIAIIPLIALASIRCAALKGLRNVVIGQLPEKVIHRLVLFILVIIASSFYQLDPASTMALYAFASAISFLTGALFLYHLLPLKFFSARAAYKSKAWIRSLLPLSLLAGVHVLNSYADIMTIGVILGNQDVGIYRIAVLGSSLVSLGLYAIATVYSPHISRLYSSEKYLELQRMATIAARQALFFALPITILFVFYGNHLVTVIYGESYSSASTALAILCVGQLVNTLAGLVGTILNMSGHERDVLWGVSIACLTNIVLNIILVPIYGIEGAACATVASFCLWNILLWKKVHTRLGIECTVLSSRSKVSLGK